MRRPVTVTRGIFAMLFGVAGLWILLGTGFTRGFSLAAWTLALGTFMLALAFLMGRWGYLLPAAVFYIAGLVAPGWTLGEAIGRALGIVGVTNVVLALPALVGMGIGVLTLIGVAIWGVIFPPKPRAEKDWERTHRKPPSAVSSGPPVSPASH